MTMKEDVFRLQITVHETLPVGGAQCGADAAQDVKRFGGGQRNT